MTQQKGVKIRIAGDLQETNIIVEKLREWAKPWGNRLIFRVKRYDRGPEVVTGKKYHRTFGARRYVAYVHMNISEDLLKGAQ